MMDARGWLAAFALLDRDARPSYAELESAIARAEAERTELIDIGREIESSMPAPGVWTRFDHQAFDDAKADLLLLNRGVTSCDGVKNARLAQRSGLPGMDGVERLLERLRQRLASGRVG